jgi:hypothetical protein
LYFELCSLQNLGACRSRFNAITRTKYKVQEKTTLKIVLVIAGILIAAIGGVIAYRAMFLEPSAALVITNTEVREVPNMMRTIGGIAMFLVGATVAFLAARGRR